MLRAGVASAGAARRLGPRRTPPRAAFGRPIEVIAREARRLGNRYRSTREGVSYAKADAFRRAYDGVLGEWCDALDVAHLLAVLCRPAKSSTSSARGERTLNGWGLRLDDAA